MLDELLHFFTGYGPLEFDNSGEPTGEVLKVATASLLWEVCLADNDLDKVEVDTLAAIMRDAFQISDKEVELISAICQQESSKEKLDEFVTLINDNFARDQREQIVEYGVEIAKVSHDIDMAEGLVCDLLNKRLNLES